MSEEGSSLEVNGQIVLDHAARLHLDEVDVLIQRSDEIDVYIRDGQVEKVDQSTGLGLGVRVIEAGRSGYASTEKLDSDSVRGALEQARKNATFGDAVDIAMPVVEPGQVALGDLGLYNAALEKLAVTDLLTMALEVEQVVKQTDARVIAIPTLGVGRSRHETCLMSTRGVRSSNLSNNVSAYCAILLQEGEHRKSGSEMWSSRTWDTAVSQRIGERAVSKAAALLGASSLPPATMPVVLDEYCAPQVLGLYLGGFYGEAAQKGTSRLAGRLGEQVAIKGLSLTDDPHRAGASGSTYMDREGTPTRPLELIREGVFTHFMYHEESARREGVSSTGHASRGFDSKIRTGSHNLVIPPGDSSTEELCRKAGDCLLITQLEGAAGCNPVSGDISIGVQGFLVKNGERFRAVSGITIAGNFFDLLQKIGGIGNSYQPNLSSRFIPALLIDAMAVSG